MILVWMKGKDYNIYEISVLYGFRVFLFFYKLYSNDAGYFVISEFDNGGETGKTSCVMKHRWGVLPRDRHKKAHCNLN